MDYGKHQFNEDCRKMKLENLTPEINLKGIKVTLPDINRPALPMAGYFEHFEATRLQVIGFVEYSYVKRMSEKKRRRCWRSFWITRFPALFSVVNCIRM